LDDASYETREIALIRLVANFKEDELSYLEKAKNWKGNNSIGLRTTVLFLSQKATGYNEDLKANNLKELIDYTSPKYESSIRQNAFEVALQLPPIDNEVLKNLVNASTSFRWQFNKFAKDYIRDLLKVGDYRNVFQTMLLQLPENEKVALQHLLDEKP